MSRRTRAAALLIVAGCTGAGAEPLAVDAQAWPYSAIGKLNVVLGANRRSFCSATLIGPRLVLTAAHCLWDAPRSRWVTPRVVHFVGGWNQGRYGAHAVGSRLAVAPGYAYGTGRANFAADWALVELAEALLIRPIPLAVSAGGSDAARHDIRRAGYSAATAERMTAQDRCAVEAVREPALLLHDCRAIPGESGSALLRMEAGGPQVVGVLVAGGLEDAGARSLAVPVDSFRGLAERMLSEPASVRP